MIDNSKRSKDFGRKEHVLNYACQTYQLSRPNKVGEVMALIRECQPTSYEEWSKYYFKMLMPRIRITQRWISRCLQN